MDLRHLTKEERDTIMSVVKKDEQLKEDDQKIFDEMKLAIKHLQVHPARPGISKDILCQTCNKTFRVNHRSFCQRCHQKVCKNCKVEISKGGKWICVLCLKQRNLEEMSGAWILKYQKRKYTSDTDTDVDHDMQEGELQMSPVPKRMYDGIHSLSPSDEIKQLLLRYSARSKKQPKLEEPKPAAKTLSSIVKEKEQDPKVISIDKADKEEEETKEENNLNVAEDRVSTNTQDKEKGEHTVGEYNVIAEVYTIDDFTQSTKIRHGVINGFDENEVNNNEKLPSDTLSTSSGHLQDSLVRGSLEMKIESDEEIIKPCPVHENGITLEPQTVADYDIIRTPMADRKDIGTPQVGGYHSHSKWSGLEGSNSSFEDVEEDIIESNNAHENGSLGSRHSSSKGSKKRSPLRATNNYYDEGNDDDYLFSFNSSMDVSIHQSYIESYYGD